MKHCDRDDYVPNSIIPRVLWKVKEFFRRRVEVDGKRPEIFVAFGKRLKYLPCFVNVHVEQIIVVSTLRKTLAFL